MSEFEKPAWAFVTEADVETQKHAFACVESKSNSIRSLELVQFDIVYVAVDVARITKHGHIEARKNFPPVFKVKYE